MIRNGYMVLDVGLLRAKGRLIQHEHDKALVRADTLRRTEPDSEELDYAERRLNDLAERLLLVNEALAAKGEAVIA